MIVKRYILLILSILAFAINAMAQDCYSDNRSKGVSAYNSGKYAEAKKYFQSAQNCDMKPRQNDIATWIDNCNKKINEQKQAQSSKQQITPQKQPVYAEQGALYGVFSVSLTQKVRFAQGNLQYRASTNTWRFAEYQYDIIGKANKNISSTYIGWIDLFGWGTSGYNGKFPYMTSETDTDYGDGLKNITGTNYDWGIYNAIINGGNKARMWRVLTKSEWDYLIFKRPNALQKWGIACVNEINGLVLLPDSWTLPNGLNFTSGIFHGGFESKTEDYKAVNSYTASEWAKMEASGAVFLPAAGGRSGRTKVYLVGTHGGYWLSSYYNSSVLSNVAYQIDFASYLVGSTFGSLRFGKAVRLVQDVK